MTGRQERDIIIKKQIMQKLEKLPDIMRVYYYDMLGDGKSLVTIKQYIYRTERILGDIFGGIVPEDFHKRLSTPNIKCYFASLDKCDSAAIDWAALKSFCEFLRDNDYIDSNPMSRIKRPVVRKEYEVTYLEENEIQQVFREIEQKAEPIHQKRDMAIIAMFLSTGLRCSALKQINVEDINLNNKQIRVVEKGNKTRIIPFGSELYDILKSWLCVREMHYGDALTDALFVSEKKNRISHSAINDLIAKYTSGIDKHITSHKLRSTVATTLAANGTGVQTIKEVLGHNNVQTTMRYVAVLNKDRIGAVNTLDTLLSNHERGKT